MITDLDSSINCVKLLICIGPDKLKKYDNKNLNIIVNIRLIVYSSRIILSGIAPVGVFCFSKMFCCGIDPVECSVMKLLMHQNVELKYW